MVVADRGATGKGWAAVDDFVFFSDLAACPTKPEGAAPPPDCEDLHQSLCRDGKGCYTQRQRCDFKQDCLDGTDELGCPEEYFFDECNSEATEDNCGWEELSHDDGLDWVIATGNLTNECTA